MQHDRAIVTSSAGRPNPVGLAHTTAVTEPDVDYHREKYGLVALAHYLTDVEGWPTVRLSVAAESLDALGGMNGLLPPMIDPERDRADSRYRYVFYTDIGGRIDLVAAKPGHALLVEAKGRSAKVQAGIEQLIGRTILSIEPGRSDRSYAILIPDLPSWMRMVQTARHPALSQIRVYTVSPNGVIGRCAWGGEPLPQPR